MADLMFKINDYINQAKQRIDKTPFFLPPLFLAVYLWINGSAHFENWSVEYGTMIQVYIIMLLVFFLFAKSAAEKQLKERLRISVKKYVIGFYTCFFVVTALVLTGMFTFGDISPDILWQTILIQLCIVSVAEELMFRGVLLGYMGILSSSFFFAIFHAAAYGVLWYDFDPATMIGALMFAFIFGCILAYIVKEKPQRFNIGLAGVCAIHGCYNLIILGVLAI